MEEWWTYLLPAVNGYCCRASVRMLPAFVTTGLPRFAKSELRCHTAKLVCSGASLGMEDFGRIGR